MSATVPGMSGRYDLVDPAWPGMEIGAALIERLAQSTQELSVERVEVGLPKQDFPGLPATTAFYANDDVSPLGTRMHRLRK